MHRSNRSEKGKDSRGAAALRAKRDEAALIIRLEALATVGGDGIPRLAAVPGRLHPELLRVWCRFCRCWHLHGAGYGHRAAHCADLDRRCRPVVSPYKDTGYYLVSPDRAPNRPLAPSRTPLLGGVGSEIVERKGNQSQVRDRPACAILARRGPGGGSRDGRVLAALSAYLKAKKGRKKASGVPESVPLSAQRTGKSLFRAENAEGSSPNISSVFSRLPMARWPFGWYRGIYAIPRPNKKGHSR